MIARLLLGLMLALGLVAAPVAAEPVAGGRILVLLALPPPHVRGNGDYGDAYDDGAGRAARHRIASDLARRHGLTLVEDWPMPLIGVDCFVMAVPAGRSPEQAAADMTATAGVAASQAVGVFHAQAAATRGDPLLAVQPAATLWHLADLHGFATGRGVRVAVIDSRIEADHPDLKGQVQDSENFAPGRGPAAEDHGTAVAGIIAAIADNGIGIAGVAPGARLLGLRACWQGAGGTLCDSLSLAKALYFAVEHRADIINLSLAGPADPLLARLIALAMARGMIVVAAFDRALPQGGFPASQGGVVAVSDAPVAGLRAGVYAAPGDDVPTTQAGGKWALVSGSSYAAAHVSGLFALLRERRGSGQGVPRLVASAPSGGVIDSCATLRGAAIACDCTCPQLRKLSAGLRK